MTKDQIFFLKATFKLSRVNFYDWFAIACEDAYAIRCCDVPSMSQCRIRANNIAIPLTLVLLDLSELVASFEKAE